MSNQSASRVHPLLLFSLLWLMGIPTGYLNCRSCYSSWEGALTMSIFTGAFWAFLWTGNGLLTDYLNTKIDWVREPGKRFLAGIVGTVIFSAIIILLINAAFHIIWLGKSATGFFADSGVIGSFISSFMITTLVSLFLHGRSFLFSWRQSAINEERLSAEILSSRYESLKSQVNPHFLFNSLNALTSLVYKDQDQAVLFIRKLADVYRYVLDTRDTELVPLRHELAFVNDYVFLQKIRYDESLQIDIRVDSMLNSHIPPLALQMLLENAVKHNIISEDDPLQVEVFIEQDYLVVRNNLQPKSTMEENTGLGLQNIAARYEFLSNRKVLVEATPKYFVVKLPILRSQPSPEITAVTS
ncbi:hypothetical protein GCM10023189_58450 [Nibrella saemangeumensis]|uniref:Signal transduction histidine kinase internal region domain-containing protein n=1 Tax=Nibrella saemangeumensis TaxID=1084526 RepID=A0ABP8NPE0_9BACT